MRGRAKPTGSNPGRAPRSDPTGDADGDGFIEYSRKTDQGLAHQGWKDSWDGINFADGRSAQPPIALAEVQGYCYAAYRARAAFAREAGDTPRARHWDGKAAQLKRAFNQAFWLPDQGWFAVALDRDKRPVDALTSNIGHCLWTGIADASKAVAVADRLLSGDMFSGWGIRTLAMSMSAHNPMSYHNGSVWPHDNALCAAGLMRYGLTGHAQRVAQAIFDAAAHFGDRLPELFCGFPREEYPVPIPYPTSCSPQAWAAAAPLQLLTTLLRITPQPSAGRFWCAPAHARRLPAAAGNRSPARTIAPDHRYPRRQLGPHRPGRHRHRTHPRATDLPLHRRHVILALGMSCGKGLGEPVERHRLDTGPDNLVVAARAVGVTDPRVLEAIRRTPRAAFVPAAYVTRANDDAPIPIPHHQVTTQPSLPARIIAAVGLTGTEEVFEVGTGYGYQTALLARLAARVVSIDMWPDLAEQARRNLAGKASATLWSWRVTEPRGPRISLRSTRSWSPPPTQACRRRCPPSSR